MNALIAMANKDDIGYFRNLLTNPALSSWHSSFIPTYAKLAKMEALPMLRETLNWEIDGAVAAAIREIGKLKDGYSREGILKLTEHKAAFVLKEVRRALERLNKVN